MKLMVSPAKVEDLTSLINININSFLFGIKHLSLYHNFYLTINEIEDIIIKHPDIEVFVSLNKLIHNHDLVLLEKTLIKISTLNIKGVLYDDLAILTIVKRLNLSINLIWGSSHLVTNYHTINTLKDSIKGALLSSELTLHEIVTIGTNAGLNIIVPIYGYQVMTTSKRNLISNYKNFTDLKLPDNLYYLKGEEDLYPVIEDENGTHILSSQILNGINEMDVLKESNIEYLYLSSLNLDSNTFNQIVTIFKNKLDEKDINSNDIIALTPNTSTLFFYQESYFKVADND